MFDFLTFSKMNRQDNRGLLIENHFLTIMDRSDKILSEMKIIFLASLACHFPLASEVSYD